MDDIPDASETADRPPDPTTEAWAAYIDWAVRQAGGVGALATRSGLDRRTLSKWRSARQGAERVTVQSIRKVAAAVGDDPRNAMRAAGRAVAGDPAEPAPAVGPPAMTLAEHLARINRRIDQIVASGLPVREILAEVETQQALADRLVAFYASQVERDPEAGSGDGGAAPRSA